MSENLIAVIGGSGLGNSLCEHFTQQEKVQIDTPFGQPSDKITTGKIGENKVAFLNRHGPGHKLPPSKIPNLANIFALKKAGAKALITTGAVGSLRENIHPGQIVIPDQVIDKTFKRENTFFENFAAVHCELAEPYCTRLRKILIHAAENAQTKTHTSGTYVCMEGPQFSTRAESLMHRQWGADLIGMTAMPEAKLAREAQLCTALIAMPSDYDCWRENETSKDAQTLLAEIIGNLQTCTNNAIGLIKTAMENSNSLCDQNCHCRKSLALAVWTDKSALDSVQMNKLKILFD